MLSVNFLSVTFILIATACTTTDSFGQDIGFDTRILPNPHTCSSIEPPEHGFVRIAQTGHYDFTCEDGYMINKVPFVSCASYDKEKDKPQCVKPTGTCPKPDPPKNGAVECDEDLTPGKYCRYKCFEGYKLYGSSLRRCQLNNQMDGGARCDRIPIPGSDPFDYFEDDESEESFEKIPYEPISHSVEKYPSPPPTHTEPTDGHTCLNLQCEQLCLIKDGIPHCRCCAGFKLNVDNRTCRENNRNRINMNACLREHKKVGDVELRPCAGGFRFDYHRNSCIATVALSRPTSQAPTSSFRSCSVNNGGCQHDCIAINSRTVTCKCRNGYKLHPDGKLCVVEELECRRDSQCPMRHICVYNRCIIGCRTDENCGFEEACINSVCQDPCSIFGACGRNANCRPINHKPECSCPVNLRGNPKVVCQQENSPGLPSVFHPIPSFENCSWRNGGCLHYCEMKDSTSVTCSCQNGYELHSNGKHCIDINECRINNFGCSHRCVNFQGGAYCTCPNGFYLDADKKTCIDIDECLQDDKNRCQYRCINTVGSYTCSCKPGYILIEGYICEGCRINSYWSHQRNACVDCPKNSHSDSEGKTSLRDCVCDSGFTGNPGEYVPCEDIDECQVNNFGCSHTCTNIPGSAYCTCPSGFMLDIDNKTCIDIDECKTKNGGCEGLCINTNGSFHCVCPEGFTASSNDRYSCDDIDECSENKGGCEQLCINYRGGFYCACNPGYRLDNTFKNCTEVRCPRLPTPHYSHADCKYKNMTLLDEEITYPAGTKCSFPCSKGFKNIKDDNKLKCERDGSWKGTLPECKPQSCPPLRVPENGEIHPASCYTQGAKVKQKCTFSCHAGYILEGFPVFTCRNDLTWSKKDHETPVCRPVKIQPVIKCPEDIQVILLRGEATQNISVPEPTSNVEYYEVHPSWVTVNKPVEFPVGVTQVTFTANSSFGEIAECVMTVTVLDEEPPVFYFCPDSITIEGANGDGEFVTWDEPVVTDNVKLVSVFSILEPNTTLAPGTYLAEYVASDSSGNIAKCSFNVSIVRTNCGDLRDPVHGKANCMEWMFGKLCSPECDEGYMRNPDDPLYYSCDNSGVWEPNDLITECLEYTLATPSGCQDGFELKKVQIDILEDEVCIACPSNAVWSTTTRKCE